MLVLARRYMTAREGIISEGTVTTMRFRKGLLVGIAAIGLVGCSGGVSGTPSVSPMATARSTASSVPPASPQMKAGARAAAAQFYGLYSDKPVRGPLEPASPHHQTSDPETSLGKRP